MKIALFYFTTMEISFDIETKNGKTRKFNKKVQKFNSSQIDLFGKYL